MQHQNVQTFLLCVNQKVLWPWSVNYTKVTVIIDHNDNKKKSKTNSKSNTLYFTDQNRIPETKIIPKKMKQSKNETFPEIEMKC